MNEKELLEKELLEKELLKKAFPDYNITMNNSSGVFHSKIGIVGKIGPPIGKSYIMAPDIYLDDESFWQLFGNGEVGKNRKLNNYWKTRKRGRNGDSI